MQKIKAMQWAGWYGATAIVGAYALVIFRVFGSESVPYQVLNLTGALGIIVVSAAKGVTQSVVLNVFWAVIAIVALIHLALA